MEDNLGETHGVGSMASQKRREKVKNYQDMKSSSSRFLMVLAALLVTIGITSCCTSSPISGTGSAPVEPGTIDQHGNPAPSDAICVSGKKCVNTGKGCGLFPYKNVCTNVWNSETNECSCECQSES